MCKLKSSYMCVVHHLINSQTLAQCLIIFNQYYKYTFDLPIVVTEQELLIPFRGTRNRTLHLHYSNYRIELYGRVIARKSYFSSYYQLRYRIQVDVMQLSGFLDRILYQGKNSFSPTTVQRRDTHRNHNQMNNQDDIRPLFLLCWDPSI